MQVYIQGRGCNVDTAQWIGFLHAAFPKNGLRAAYLYVNQEGELSTSPTHVYQPDRIKLRVSDIIATSRVVFNSYQTCSAIENRAIREIYTKIIPRATNSWCSMILHWLLGFGFSSTLELLARELGVLERARQSTLIISQINTLKATFDQQLITLQSYAEQSADARFTSRYRPFEENYRDWDSRFSAVDQSTPVNYQQLKTELLEQQQALNRMINLYSSLLELAHRKTKLSEALERIADNYPKRYNNEDDSKITRYISFEDELAAFVDQLFKNETFDYLQITENIIELTQRLSKLERKVNCVSQSTPSSSESTSSHRFSKSPFKQNLNSPLLKKGRTPSKPNRLTPRALDFTSNS